MTSEKHEETVVANPAAEETVNPDRRAFIRKAALAAGAASVIAATIGVEEAQAAPSPLAADPRIARKVLKAGFDGNYEVKLDHVYAVVEQLLDIAGCPTCGLVGFDLNLRINPVEQLKLEIPVSLEIQNH